jgi:hypothetical protein
LYKVKEIFEGFIAFEVEFRLVCPDVFANFKGDEEVEGCCFALDCLKG